MPFLWGETSMTLISQIHWCERISFLLGSVIFLGQGLDWSFRLPGSPGSTGLNGGVQGRFIGGGMVVVSPPWRHIPGFENFLLVFCGVK